MSVNDSSYSKFYEICKKDKKHMWILFHPYYRNKFIKFLFTINDEWVAYYNTIHDDTVLVIDYSISNKSDLNDILHQIKTKESVGECIVDSYSLRKRFY